MFGPNGPKRLCDVITGDETWIPFYGIPNKRSNMAWVGLDQARPAVLRPSFRSRKRPFSIFFNTQGSVTVDILPEKLTSTASYYAGTILPKVIGSVFEQRSTVGTSRTMLLYENASAHTAKVTVTYLEEQSVQVLPHPPYGQDWSPSDFWLFPRVKRISSGETFSCTRDLPKAVKSELDTIPLLVYHITFAY